MLVAKILAEYDDWEDACATDSSLQATAQSAWIRRESRRE